MANKTLNAITTQFAFVGAMLISTGFIIADRSPAPQSIGVALIFLSPLVTGKGKLAIKTLIKNKLMLGLVAYYIMLLISVFYTSNWTNFFNIILMQIPLIFIPLGLYDKDVLTGRQINIVLSVLVSAVLIAGLASLINYIANFDAIQEQISHSKPIRIITGVNHIYYSILLAFSAGVFQWWLIVKKVPEKNLRILAWVGFVINILLLHTISARTGLLCFYVEALASIVFLSIRSKTFLPGFLLTLGMILLAYMTIKLVPSVASRMTNTKKDINKYESGQDINHYSISMRLAALKIGSVVFMKSPIIGVGSADIRDEMDNEYIEEKSGLLKENRVKPHNQFLYTLVAMGIIGALILAYIMFMPFVGGAIFKNYLFLVFIIICLVAYQAEYMLERQVGITFFCLFFTILAVNKDFFAFPKKEGANATSQEVKV